MMLRAHSIARRLLLAVAAITPFALFAPGSARAEEPTAARPPEPPLSINILEKKLGKDGRLTAQLEVVTNLDGTPTVEALVDGHPSPEARVELVSDVAGQLLYSATWTPPARTAALTLTASLGGQKSAPVALRVRVVDGKLVLDARASLYVLAIGVGPYQDRHIPSLTYPPKDARDLINVLSTQRDDLYRKVESLLVVDKDATRAGVAAGLRWIADKAQPGDAAVIFLAGHGTNDPNDAYFYLPYDARAGDMSSMYAGAELEEALGHIRSNVVVLLDTCHSGNVLGKTSLDKLISRLIAGQHVVVIAAATGDQTSRESAAWGNGVFTKSLVEGLRGRSDFLEDGALNVSELEGWLGSRVRELTNGAQTPTLAKPRAETDYTMAALPKHDPLPGPKQELRRRVYWSLGAVGLVLAGVGIGLAVAQPWDPTPVLHPEFPK